MITKTLYRLSKRRSRINLYEWLTAAILREGVAEATNVLNIGAGGEIAARLESLGIKPLSIDVDPNRQPDIIASAEAMTMVGAASVDTVFCLEVLEHVERPEMAVAEFERVLRPGGCVIGSTPFLLGIHDTPNDFRRFTRFGLRQLFGNFEEIELRERNGYFAAAAVLVYRRFALDAPLRGTSILRVPLLLLVAFGLEVLDWLHPCKDGTTGYFFVYRKPSNNTTAIG